MRYEKEQEKSEMDHFPLIRVSGIFHQHTKTCVFFEIFTGNLLTGVKNWGLGEDC
jgi:hypothetical protein